MERRAAPRAECRVEASLDCGGDPFPANTVNVSVKGALVNTAASPRSCEPVAITLFLSDGGTWSAVRCPGRVVRADAGRLGIEFDEMSRQAFTRVRSLIAANSADPPAAQTHAA